MADIDELVQRIQGIAAERLMLDVPADKPLPSESLTEVYGVDSVRLFDLVVGLEADFGIQFEDRELKLAHFDTVLDIARRVQDKLDGA